MTLHERLAMMDGDLQFYSGLFELTQRDFYHRKPFPAGVNERLGIEGVQFIDGPRGIVLKGGATTFPVSMARGATFDPELEERIGDAIGKELRSHGGNLFGGVCINLLRHPAWGRAQETYGEDPYHLGVMGSALVRGVEQHGMACVKHFAANSMENARFQVDVTLRPRVLHEMYLPHFKACIDAGASAVMSAYNAVNGAWCGQNEELLSDILRKRWGFDGFVVTDFMFGVRDAERGVLAGQDLEMPFRFIFRDKLKSLVTSGRVPPERIDQSVLRILRKLLPLPPKERYPKTVRACAAHTALAREAARKSIVLLKNEQSVLPLKDNQRLAVFGELAAVPNLGDRGSSDGRPEYVITPLDGLRSALSGRVRFEDGSDLERARAVATEADVALVIVGYTHREEGEHVAPPSIEPFVDLFPPPKPLRARWLRSGWSKLVRKLSSQVLAYTQRHLENDDKSFSAGGDRTSLELPEHHVALIRAVVKANPRTVVAIMAGSAVITSAWDELVPGLMLLWYPGMEGGHAVADIVTGRHSPSGRLPFAIPKAASDLPAFDIDAHHVEYDLWHGYRKLARDGVAPAHPFGFGLSYTDFEYRNLAVEDDSVPPDGELRVSVDVHNVGERAGDEVVQLYVSVEGSRVDRAPRELKAFTRLSLAAREHRRVTLTVPVSRLAYFDEDVDDFVVEPTRYRITVARHERDAGLSAEITIT